MAKAYKLGKFGTLLNPPKLLRYNRTDCCAARLSNYQVSISNKADFSTHTYQQDFHVAPNPMPIPPNLESPHDTIDLSA
jgi:hypothetical protein